MDKEKFGDWGQIVGLFAVFASLLFVGYEIRQSGRVANEESLQSEQANITSIETLVVENADVVLRGCLGEELEPREQLVFTRIYQVYSFRAFLAWVRTREGVSPGSESLAIDNMAINLHRSAGLRREWRLHEEWRSYVPDEALWQTWRQLVDSRLEAMPALEPTPVMDVSRCLT